ncbi:MAG TPA: methyl-accepting chemotaxis protein, partial [Stenomitos sp.]
MNANFQRYGVVGLQGLCVGLIVMVASLKAPGWLLALLAAGVAMALAAWQSARQPKQAPIVEALEHMAHGDFTQTMAEAGPASRAFQGLMLRFNEAFVDLSVKTIHAGVKSKEASTELARVRVRADEEATAIKEIAQDIRQIATSSAHLGAEMGRLREATDVTSSAVEELSGSIRQVSGHAGSLREQAQDLFTATERIGGLVGETAQAIRQATTVVESTDRVAVESREVVRRNTESIERIGKVVLESSEVIHQL